MKGENCVGELSLKRTRSTGGGVHVGAEDEGAIGDGEAEHQTLKRAVDEEVMGFC